MAALKMTILCARPGALKLLAQSALLLLNLAGLGHAADADATTGLSDFMGPSSSFDISDLSLIPEATMFPVSDLGNATMESKNPKGYPYYEEVTVSFTTSYIFRIVGPCTITDGAESTASAPQP